MALYADPYPYVYDKSTRNGKDPFLSMNNGAFHANFSFLVDITFPGVAPVVLERAIWTAVNINKSCIKFDEFSVVQNKFLYFNGPGANDSIVFSLLDDSPWIEYMYYISVGIGSHDIRATAVPAANPMTTFYQANYNTFELVNHSKNQYELLAPDSVIQLKSQNNYINCALSVNNIFTDTLNHDITNWHTQLVANYNNFTMAASTFDKLSIIFNVHINGKYKD